MSVNPLSDDADHALHLSVNPLLKYQNKNTKPTEQWKFLTSESLKNFGTKKSQYQNDIRNNHLAKPLRQIHHVLQHTKNLREQDIYKIFNARTLEVFFRNLLRECKYNSPLTNTIRNHGQNKYDFRTAELARLMIEIAIEYYLDSPEFQNNKKFINIKDDLYEYLETFSISKLQQDIVNPTYIETVKEERREKITENNKIIQNEIVNLFSKINLPIDDENKNSRTASTHVISLIKNRLLDLELLELKLKRIKNTKTRKNEISEIRQEIIEKKKILELAEKDLETIQEISEKEHELFENESELMGQLVDFIDIFRPIRYNEKILISKQFPDFESKIINNYFCVKCGGIAKKTNESRHKCQNCGLEIEYSKQLMS